MTKKILIIVEIVVCYIYSGNAQQVESLHTIKAGIPSITYSYEHALGKQFNINMEVGTNWGYYYSNNHG